MPFLSSNVRRSLVTLSILAAFTGFMSTGCSPSDSVVVEPAAVTDGAPEASAADTVPAESSNAGQSEASGLDDGSAISAAEAGEDAFAVEDHSDVLTADEAGEDAFAVEDNAWEAGGDYVFAGVTDEADLTTEDGTVLAEIVPGVAVGMPYEVARILILDDGWRPADGLQPASRNGLDYPEIEDCSGTGLGFCLMTFHDAELDVFEVVVTTASGEPTVRNWSFSW